MDTRQLEDQALLNGLNAHPQIKARIVSLMAAVVDAAGDLKKADAAEERMIEEMRRMGQEALQAWAEGQVKKSEQALREQGRVQREGKKNSAGTQHSVI
jgi:membrane-bound ClpP family serine protease